MSLLHAQNLSHGYTSGGLLTRKHRIQVLHDLSLTLHEHQSLGLLGGSGSGKSTLARLLMGIEAPEQVDFLRSIGCDLVQGYVYARPMPAEELEAWMRARHGGEVTQI